MKIYIPITQEHVGGGWTFYRNFIKGVKGKAEIVDNLRDCDVLLVSGVTMVEKNVLNDAKLLNKKIVFRIDNVPKKSRNKRCTPHERMKEFSALADLVIYQSNWAKEYASPLCKNGPVIYNGVDTEIFNHDDKWEERDPIYFFAFHGNNELKGFWTAHLIFQQEFKKNRDSQFLFIYDFGKAEPELRESNFDFWNNESYVHLPKETDPKRMADIMRQCKYLIYPAIADASPNIVSEAMACGCKVIGYADNDLSGTREVILNNINIPYTIQEMADEYLTEINKLT